MKVAILDLGTNVFNLLIARISKDKCDIRKVVKIPSQIGSGGFAKGYLDELAIESSMEAMSDIMHEIEANSRVDLIKAFATSAVRDAKNGKNFTAEIKAKFGVDVEIISGEREAELIYKGIRESILLYNEKVLMCDIGGGSNELIIADKEQIYWKESFNLGVVRMKEIFNPSDPMKDTEIEDINVFLEASLKNLWTACREHNPKLMIGSSGSFDTLRELLNPDDEGTLPAMQLDINKLTDLHNKLLLSTKDDRMQMKGMSPIRVDYMVLGSIFVQLVIKKSNIEELYQSSYSLKEGFMAEIAESLNKT